MLGHIAGEARILVNVVYRNRLSRRHNPAGDALADRDGHSNNLFFPVAGSHVEREVLLPFIEKSEGTCFGVEDPPRCFSYRMQKLAGSAASVRPRSVPSCESSARMSFDLAISPPRLSA